MKAYSPPLAEAVRFTASDQLFPLSVLRRTTMSVWLLSIHDSWRASQKTSSEPSPAVTIEGMR